MEKEKNFDPLDMNNYRIEKLPKMQKSGVEKWMAIIGGPLAIIVFALIYWVIDIPFLNTLSADGLDKTAMARLDILGYEAFIRINYAMLAIFAASIVLWITEAVPNYLTSLLVIFGIVIFGVTTEKTAFAQLGHPVMWLNILSFVLASMLVKTQVAKRFALWFMVRFGKSASWIVFSFIVINIVLSAFISATTAKAAILLPIFMVIAAIYGATGGSNRNNFGRNLVLQNLFQINVGASGFLTGAGSNLLAAALMAGALGGRIFSYQDWFIAGFPLAIILILIAWFVGSKIIFPLKEEEKIPQIEGGMERLREELHKLGKMGVQEYKAIAIFVVVLILWATDKQHGISQTTVAFAGAIVALLPGIGIVNWNEVDIPWHLMLFSAGAYALGVGLDATGLPGTIVNVSFEKMGITAATPFWVIYMVLTFLMLFSALLFQSKTMRTLIFVPIALGIEQQFGFPTLSLAFPVALLNNHVYVLPFNSKPAALLYTTDQYSWSDTFKFGFTMMIIAWVMIIVWGETVFRWLGYTNGLFF
ncbi:DASS family sodium-coupled anion symporter [Proteiniphilum sp.]|uniref:DASS family sodium-coupled anion symporter n=1 Tax=Proteiniphilum sp. TaxID=1926877 RepID=UPI002B215686|nr:DASS family sodium-coupled anion symporter [Proteiniphilum sp.]MEA4916682.1 DASS family sodium-coupled anion symporter [Proteiniphilum sp.]